MLVRRMPEEQQLESSGPTQAKRPGGRRRGRRGGRGRSRGSRPPAPAVPAISASDQPDQAESTTKQIEPPIRLREEMPVRPVPSKQKVQPTVPHVPPDRTVIPASRAAKPEGSAIGQTVGEVRQIVESLEQALEEMVEVLRLVELAEQQKFADEREIESLRRALHKLQPPHRERREQGG